MLQTINEQFQTTHQNNVDFQGSLISLVHCISWKQSPQMEAQFCSPILVTSDKLTCPLGMSHL